MGWDRVMQLRTIHLTADEGDALLMKLQWLKRYIDEGKAEQHKARQRT